MESSVIYSMGTALNRARQLGVDVQVLVDSEWLDGRVMGVDGHGVLLEIGSHEHAVVRLESVSAVRIQARAPEGIAIPAQMQPAN